MHFYKHKSRCSNTTRLLKPAVKESATDTFDASITLKEFDHLHSNNVEMEAHVTYTFDEREFLRQFDYLQSDNVDILARAMELSSIPSDSNNNDLLSHAMKLSEINGEIDMNF